MAYSTGLVFFQKSGYVTFYAGKYLNQYGSNKVKLGMEYFGLGPRAETRAPKWLFPDCWNSVLTPDLVPHDFLFNYFYVQLLD